MAEYNQIEVPVIPETPKIVSDEVRFIYVPLASYGRPGIAKFDEKYFKIGKDGEVSVDVNALHDFPFSSDEYRNLYLDGDLYGSKYVNVGANNVAGLKGFYWASINVSTKTITLSTEHYPYGKNESFNISDYWSVGDILSIHSNQKWTNCSKILSIDGKTLTVDKLPFASPTVKNEHFTDSAVYVLAKPLNGLVDFAKYAYAFGDGSKATNYCTFVAGRDCEALDQYAAVFGRLNKGDHAAFIGGVRNWVLQEYGASAGSNNYIDAKQSTAFGKANVIINNAYRSAALGAYNSIGGDTTTMRGDTTIVPQAIVRDGEYAQRNPGQYGFAAGYGNDIRGFVGVGLGDQNKVFGDNATAIGFANSTDSPNTVIIGNNSKITNSKWSVAVTGTMPNLIYGDGETEGQMIFGSHNLINTRRATPEDKHNGIGDYNYIVGGDQCEILDNAYECVVGGKLNIAKGYRTTLFGDSNTDDGCTRVTVFGFHNYPTRNHQTVLGQWATPNVNSLFTIGNGWNTFVNGTVDQVATYQRSNAFEVIDDDGSISLKIGASTLSETEILQYQKFSKFLTSATVSSNDSIAIGTAASAIDANSPKAFSVTGATPNQIRGESVLVNGVYQGRIGNMIFGSGNTINTRTKQTGDKHDGSGQYNYIVGGDACTISGNAHQCVVGGKAHTATGYRTTAFGESNNDGGFKNTTLLGKGNIALAHNQTIVGVYSNPTANTIFAVGNGTASTSRINAFEVAKIDGSYTIKIGNTAITEAQLQSLIALI